MNINIQKDDENRRIEWVDISKAICIICVVTTHSSYCNDFIRAIFEPFFLIAFFFLSGYVYKNKYDFKELLKNKAKTILFPWLIFGIFNILLSQLYSFNKHDDLITEIGLMFLQIRGYSDALWFLPCLFISFIPFYFFTRHFNKKNLLIVFLLSLLSILYCKYAKLDLFFQSNYALPWHLQIIFITCFFMLMGYWYKNYNLLIDKYLDNSKIIILLGIIYIIDVYVNYIVFGNIVSISSYNSNILVWYFTSILGLLILISFSKKIKTNKIIKFIGCNTILIFCLHGKVLSVLENISRNIFIKLELYNFINLLITVIITLIILVIPIKIILKYFPFLIGKQVRK